MAISWFSTERPTMNGATIRARAASGLVALLAVFGAHAQSRGELLYTTHCLGCHSTEMHWRDGRAATDFAGVLFQVRKWQNASSLSWNERDVFAVAGYLNATFYRFEAPSISRSSDLDGPASATGLIVLRMPSP